ncbi:MAG: hypothetical protein J3R72DRAFT_486601 [Linnemannia gamsii]|nr:MAG: hypothetical protein J3R72DRAFT_486601 [Linnemannia gamsii]
MMKQGGISNAFSVKIRLSDNVDGLKKLIKAEKTNAFKLNPTDDISDVFAETPSENSTNANTQFARKVTLLIFLSRLMILSYCLKVPSCRQTFSSARWGLPHMFKDVFMHLFLKLCDLKAGHTVSKPILTSVVRGEFESAQEALAVRCYPNFQTSPSFGWSSTKPRSRSTGTPRRSRRLPSKAAFA